MTTTTLRPVTESPEPSGPWRPSRRAVIIAVAVTVVVAVLATWLIAFSSVFGVRTVEVRGVHALTAAQVRSAAAITKGTPLVRLDTAAVTRRVEQLADVESAEVSTSFPSTVVITVVERVPVGYVQLGGRTMLVDRTGDQYHQVAGVPAGLPKFVVPVGSSARTTGGAVAVVAAALSPSLRKQVLSVQALDPGAITLVLTQGRLVQWGSADRSADKARILPVLLGQGASHIDVSNPDQPFTR